ncbi:MAG TPA: hypothetical protein VKG44_10245, partial [Candidatus Baltobacteraceae bacterium]|nr:hypothetical protein [Candidatus Baltobacteraceae bacterium]
IGYVGLEGQPKDSSSFPFLAHNSGGGDVAYIDNAGDFFYHGSLNTFVSTRSGNVGRMYVNGSTMQTIEDFGSGAILNGSGSVHFDAAFADTMDASGGYQVFLTPDGDSRGLFVASKTPAGFTVRESQGGRSSISFDYRIVAKRNGHASDRLAVAHSAADFGEPRALSLATTSGRQAALKSRFATSAHMTAKARAVQLRAYTGPPKQPAMPAALLNFTHAH